MSLLENVAIGAHLRGYAGPLKALLRLDRAEEARLFAEAHRQLARVGLAAKSSEPASSLALGQQRIAEIARALCLDPILLLLDEPAAGLRHAEKLELAALLQVLKSQGVTILLVEHDMAFRHEPNRPPRGDEFRIKTGRRTDCVCRSRPGGHRSLFGKSCVILEVDGLNVAYRGVGALHDVALNVGSGQIVTVIGPNGAGKTTLLNAIMGVHGGAGSINFAGRNIVRVPVEARVRSGISLVPEKRELFVSLSVQDNLRLGAFRFRHQNTSISRQQLDEVFALFPRLYDRRRQLAGTLSGGERQMLAMGRALMSQPDLLMLDEPSLGLAPLIVKEIFAIIAALRARNCSILLVEQNARAALKIADYGYVLELGRVTLEGTGDELATDPRLIQTYLGGS